MQIREFLIKFTEDVRLFNYKISPIFIFCYGDTLRMYELDIFSDMFKVRISLYDLDIVNSNSLDKEWVAKLRIMITELRLLRYKDEIQRRIFLDYIKLLCPNSWANLKYIERDRPDFCVFLEDRKIGFEVSEAISNNDANFRKMLKYTTGRNFTIDDFKLYSEKKHKTYHKNFRIENFQDSVILSSHHGLVDTKDIRNLIITSILEKVTKAVFYDRFDENNLIIGYSNIGFDNEYDFSEVEEGLLENLCDNNTFNKIIVCSGLYKSMIEYDGKGKLVRYNKLEVESL